MKNKLIFKNKKLKKTFKKCNYKNNNYKIK